MGRLRAPVAAGLATLAVACCALPLVAGGRYTGAARRRAARSPRGGRLDRGRAAGRAAVDRLLAAAGGRSGSGLPDRWALPVAGLVGGATARERRPGARHVGSGRDAGLWAAVVLGVTAVAARRRPSAGPGRARGGGGAGRRLWSPGSCPRPAPRRPTGPSCASRTSPTWAAAQRRHRATGGGPAAHAPRRVRRGGHRRRHRHLRSRPRPTSWPGCPPTTGSGTRAGSSAWRATGSRASSPPARCWSPGSAPATRRPSTSAASPTRAPSARTARCGCAATASPQPPSAASTCTPTPARSRSTSPCCPSSRSTRRSGRPRSPPPTCCRCPTAPSAAPRAGSNG